MPYIFGDRRGVRTGGVVGVDPVQERETGAGYAIRVYHRTESYFVSWLAYGRRIGLSKHAERARRFGTLEVATATLDQIDRLRDTATVVEMPRPYSGVGVIGRDPDDVILGWSQPGDKGTRTRARVEGPAILVECCDLPADWIAAQTGISRNRIWSRPDALRRAEARGNTRKPNASKAEMPQGLGHLQRRHNRR